MSRRSQHALSEALSISEQVIAVTVVTSDTGQITSEERALQEEWARWSPGPPLRVLRTEYASVAGPILAFIDQLRERHTEQIVVLVPVTVPDRLRYRLLHNHLDLVLTAALRHRPDVVTARVPLPLHLPPGRRDTSHAAGSQPD